MNVAPQRTQALLVKFDNEEKNRFAVLLIFCSEYIFEFVSILSLNIDIYVCNDSMVCVTLTIRRICMKSEHNYRIVKV